MTIETETDDPVLENFLKNIPQSMTVDFVRLIQAVMYHVTSVVHVNAQSVVTAELTEVTGAQSDQSKLHRGSVLEAKRQK